MGVTRRKGKRVMIVIVGMMLSCLLCLIAHALYWDHVATNWIADPVNGDDDKIASYIMKGWCRPWFRPVPHERQAELISASVTYLANADFGKSGEAAFVFMAIGAAWKIDGSYPTLHREVNHAIQTIGGGNIMVIYSAIVEDDLSQIDVPGALRSCRATKYPMHDIIALMTVLRKDDVVNNTSLIREILEDPNVPPLAKKAVLGWLSVYGVLQATVDQPLWETLKAEMGSHADKFIGEMEK